MSQYHAFQDDNSPHIFLTLPLHQKQCALNEQSSIIQNRHNELLVRKMNPWQGGRWPIYDPFQLRNDGKAN